VLRDDGSTPLHFTSLHPQRCKPCVVCLHVGQVTAVCALHPAERVTGAASVAVTARAHSLQFAVAFEKPYEAYGVTPPPWCS
jgi:hypothetical protein